MVEKDLAAAVNDGNKTKRSNVMPGSEDTQDNSSEEAARKRKENILEAAREDAKANFEAERKEKLDRVPEDYKKMFDCEPIRRTDG
jgi:hypothetical protein